MSDSFYIGYSEKAPKPFKKVTRWSVLVMLALVVLFSVGLAFTQQKAKNSTFEYGKPIQLEGTLYYSPYPMLRVSIGDGLSKDLLLIGLGKHGADAQLSHMIFERRGTYKMKLTGTLIYYNGVTLFEIADQSHTLLKPSAERFESSDFGEVHLDGEIVDPKCYFGVMKPGFGKIHRSCAARCISGGIPPVFVQA